MPIPFFTAHWFSRCALAVLAGAAPVLHLAWAQDAVPSPPAGLTSGAPAGLTSGAPAGLTSGAPAGLTSGATPELKLGSDRIDPTPTEPPWTKVRTRGPFTLSNRLKPGESLREFLVNGTVDAEPSELVGILKDLPNYPLWMVGCDKATLVETEDPTKPDYTSRIYLYLGAPFPFSDRDLEILVTNSQNEELGEWDFRVRALPDAEAHTKPTSDAIRVVRSQGFWKFKRAEQPGRTQVVYQWHSDPAGSLPAWIANKVTEKAPLETLENLYARAVCLREPPASNPTCTMQ